MYQEGALLHGSAAGGLVGLSVSRNRINSQCVCVCVCVFAVIVSVPRNH